MSEEFKLYVFEKFLVPFTFLFFAIYLSCIFNFCYDIYYMCKVNIAYIIVFFINKKLSDIVCDWILKYDLLMMEFRPDDR